MIADASAVRVGARWRSQLWLPRQFDQKILAIILLVEAGFVAAHVISGALLETIPAALNIAHDGSLAEWFGYILMAGAALMMWRAYRRERVVLCLTFAVVLATVMLDDSLMIHENLGAVVAREVDLVSRLGPESKDAGELVIWITIALFLLPWGIAGVIFTPVAKWPSLFLLAALIVMLAFFAVGIDFLHEPVCEAFAFHWCFQAFDIIEDGGEMLSEALIFAHVWKVFR